MPKHEFGIIDDLSNNKYLYEQYEPKKYHCISVDDDYIEPLLPELRDMDTFFHNTSRPDKGLAYWGITLIPPASFYIFKMILLTKDKGIYLKLIKIIEKAAKENKYIIHYGI